MLPTGIRRSSDVLHVCETTDEGWTACPPDLCEARLLFEENERLRAIIGRLYMRRGEDVSALRAAIRQAFGDASLVDPADEDMGQDTPQMAGGQQVGP